MDRLMMAESGGRLEARNPRSTAVGPFQFIESTFLSVARRNFAAETAGLSPQQVLALRTDMAFSRKAAEAYTRENAAVLKSLDVEPSYPNLRLAYLLGPNGAARVIKASPETPLASLMSPAVLVANPFMAGMTALGLVNRAAREVSLPATTSEGVVVPPGTMLPRRTMPQGVAVRCNIRLPSCKRWLALRSAKLATSSPAGAAKIAKAAPKGKATPQALAAGRRPIKVSPTREAAARGIPLSQLRGVFNQPPPRSAPLPTRAASPPPPPRATRLAQQPSRPR